MRFAVATLATIVFPAVLAAQVQQDIALRRPSEQQLARDIYKELVEINTADCVGSTTVAANAVAKRLRAAGFPDSDIFLGGPRPEKWNIAVRYRGKGSRRPLLLLAHLDVNAIPDTGVSVSRAPAMEHATPSPLTPEVVRPVEKLTREIFGPNFAVIPTTGTGATDSKWLRAVGIPGYGVSGLFSAPNDNRAHGRDERLLIKSYDDSQEFLYRVVKELSSGTAVP